MIKRAILLNFLLIVQLTTAHKHKTENPIIHSALNLMGIGCIIKGSSLQIPWINWIINIERKVDWEYITLGLILLGASRILRILENESHKLPKTNSQPKIEVFPFDQS